MITKDKLIETLRSELDTCRELLHEAGKREAHLQTAVDSLKTSSGLDYIPSQTRILHLQDNLVVNALHNKVIMSTTPLQQVYELQKENKKLLKDSQGVSAQLSESMRASLDTSTSCALGNVDSSKVNTRLKEVFKVLL
jgi:hypothetical protein